ncbi:MAG: hypothetical protein ACXVRJ_05335 [Gaiellaceae bacterium]
MKRLVLLVLAVAAFAPATANAAVPCRDRIYNDWYGDGKIATTYPLGCYRDALRHIPADARTYSSLSDDIRSAMQGAQARLRGHTSVPPQVGNGTGSTNPQGGSTTRKPPHDPTRPSNQPVSNTLPTSTVAAGGTGSGSGVPVPLLVLGALALLLVAVGGAGIVAKRRRL